MKNRLDLDHKIKKIKLLDAEYVFIDGSSRSGKAGIAPIISSFKRAEHWKARGSFERCLTIYQSGDLSKQGFKFLLESDLQMDVWFSMMGRDVNTNQHDQTSIINSPKYKEYFARTKRKDTPETFIKIEKEIKEKRLIFPFVCDDFMTIGNFLKDINPNFKFIIVMRNPIDLIFTWFRSGRGTRLGNDPRYIKPAFQIKKFKNIHFSMLNNAKEFSLANPLEKCFLVIEKQMTEYLNSNLLYSKNSCLVPFENYCLETEKYIKKFENFLNTKRTKFTKAEMFKANVPRKKDNEVFSKKMHMIFDNIQEKYVKRLKNLCNRYETEISDIYQLSSTTKYPKGLFKGLNIDSFSKLSSASKYHKGGRS